MAFNNWNNNVVPERLIKSHSNNSTFLTNVSVNTGVLILLSIKNKKN